MPKSKFIRVKCPDCEHEQVIFDHPSTLVKCLICGRTIAKPSGGKGEILVEIVKEYT
ncbi:MAG: small subunit ribosomal protein S27e [Archaeoglobaceae archaeon]|nr:small subunit ribosomal protein S27e [Archaeoglobaceae archaeon]MDK2875826.1 small subunit ribosomal protein S27e [Archaeoglobaceae archaeon]